MKNGVKDGVGAERYNLFMEKICLYLPVVSCQVLKVLQARVRLPEKKLRKL